MDHGSLDKSGLNGRPFDPIVARVADRLIERSRAGMAKYGATLERTDLNTVAWLRHAQEEALDLAAYLERVISDLEGRRDEALAADPQAGQKGGGE
jgi:hypothetical protein